MRIWQENVNLDHKLKKKKKDEIRNDLYFVFCFCCHWLCFNFEICFIANVNDSSALAINISVITARIKKYKSIPKKKRKKHIKIVLLAKNKLNTIEVLIFKALRNLCNCNEKIFVVNNVLREYNQTKKQIKNHKNIVEYTI